MQKSLEKKITAGFGAVLVILGIIGIASYLSTTQLVKTANRVAHTHKILEDLEELLSELKDVESGGRGYVITGKETYLQPYQAAIRVIEQDVEELEESVLDNPNQQQRLRILKPLIASRLTVTNETVNLRRTKGFEAALQLVLTDKGKQIMNDIRAVIHEMETEEETKLRRRAEAAAISARNTITVIALGSVVTFLLIPLANFVISREIAERKRVEGALRKSERRFQIFMDSSPAVVFIKDEQGQYVYINQPLEHRFNINLADLQGKTDFAFLPEQVAKQVRENDALVLATGKVTEIVETVPTPDGASNHWLSFKFPFRDSATQTYIGGVAFDITKRLQLEEALQRSHVELEIRVQERTAELETANAELQKEVTGRRKAEEEVRLLQAITQAISESPNFHSALEVTLQKVCEATNWNFGEVWIPCSDGTVLEYAPVGYGSSSSLEQFRRLSQEFTFPPGTGLPGRVWSSKQPKWILGVSEKSDSTFSRAQIAMEVGLKAGLGVPIIANEQVLAVLVFFTFEPHKEDKHLVELVSAIATQLGSAIQRKKAEEGLQAEIIERRRAEQALQKSYAGLEIRVEERTAQLRRTIELLQGEVSERKLVEEELRSSEERFRLLVEDVKDYAIFMLCPSGRVVSWNAGAERINGYQAEEIIGQHFSYFHSREDIELGRPGQELQVAVAAGRVEIEGWRVCKDGSRYWANVIITALWNQNGQLYGFSNVTRNITQRRLAEENIRNALAKERELSQIKSSFISGASHEFRTPLTTILTFSELLEQYNHKWAEEKKQEYLRRIQAAVKHMIRLLDDVLLINKAEAGKLEFNPTPLNLEEFCRTLAEELQLSDNAQHSINLVIQNSCPEQVHMDEKLLRQIFTNLLSNAIKYSPVEEDIQFKLSCQDGEVVFQVKDQGIGIPPEDQQHLFESFHRAKNTSNLPGTGLGLSIVKQCVEMHSGKIRVDSELGIGTTVSVTLPFNPGLKQ